MTEQKNHSVKPDEHKPFSEDHASVHAAPQNCINIFPLHRSVSSFTEKSVGAQPDVGSEQWPMKDTVGADQNTRRLQQHLLMQFGT